jgi:hypothetical protein
MSDAAKFTLNGPISRQPVPRAEPLVEGRRYRVWLRIGEISQGSVCVWVGGNRTDFFSHAGEHSQQVVAGERPDVAVQGLNAVATIEGVAVSDAAD